MSGASDDLLRAAVRQVLDEVLGDVLHDVTEGPAARGGHGAGATTPVTVTSQADLDALVRRVLADADDPAARRAWRDGRRRAVLHAPPTSSVPGPRRRGTDVGAPLGDGTPLGGAVTERLVLDAARDGRDLVLGPRAVVTPLARERARREGVRLVREEHPHPDEGRARRARNGR